MPSLNSRGHRLVWGWILMGPVLLAATPLIVHAEEDETKPTARIGRRPVQLWPPFEEQEPVKPGTALNLGGWTYRAIKNPHPEEGVPWKLLVTPAGENTHLWRKGRRESALPLAFAMINRGEGPKKADAIPIIELPQVVWKQRMAPYLQDVVGIHFHEFLSNDVAQILFTMHKIPPDNPDGTEMENYQGQPGTRIEATLLAPVEWSLDQSIVVRVDPLRKDLLQSRDQHEIGHSKVSHQVLLSVLRGPQDWNLAACTGRRSNLAYYWRREQIGRSWTGYYNSIGKLLTLRTTIVLVPPTRWSMLLPIPPQRVTQKHIQDFNKSIVKLGPQFTAADQIAQKQFHALHGKYENPGTR